MDKKVYVMPQTSTIKVAAEGLMAASSIKVNDSVSGNQQLADEMDTPWSSESWSEE